MPGTWPIPNKLSEMSAWARGLGLRDVPLQARAHPSLAHPAGADRLIEPGTGLLISAFPRLVTVHASPRVASRFGNLKGDSL